MKHIAKQGLSSALAVLALGSLLIQPVSARELAEQPAQLQPDRDSRRPYLPGNSYYESTIRCESFGNRYRACPVRTKGRVVLERRRNGRCRQGRDWGYDARRIWVTNNCRATFAYGYGSYVPRYRSDSSDTGKIIGGVVVAAGLVALLTSGSKGPRKADSLPAQSRAQVVANDASVKSAARTGLSACLSKAASNVAATGGDRIEMTSVNVEELDTSTHRFEVDVRASYPDQPRNLAFSCTAHGASVEDFDFITED